MAPTVTMIIEQDPESGWYVGSIAELPGCYTQAPTLAELRANMLEALEAHSPSSRPEPLPNFVGLERLEVLAWAA